MNTYQVDMAEANALNELERHCRIGKVMRKYPPKWWKTAPPQPALIIDPNRLPVITFNTCQPSFQ